MRYKLAYILLYPVTDTGYRNEQYQFTELVGTTRSVDT
jgi:hypothetical protein